MNKIKAMFVACVVVAGIAANADTKTTYRDAQGRVQGTVTTDRYGKTTYRDYQGRVQSTETPTAMARRLGETALAAFRELPRQTATARPLIVMRRGG